jgi:putative CocE/NonD family hydrolase
MKIFVVGLLRCVAWVGVCAVAAAPVAVRAQQAAALDLKAHYTKSEYHVKVRDGVTLFTIVYAPKDGAFPGQTSFPMLMERTPYSVAPYGVDEFPRGLGPSPEFAPSGYIFVYQDIRGRYGSEGTYIKPTPHLDHPTGTEHDESTDTYDTVDWLLKNVPHNNGKVGMWGGSQAGYMASASMIDGHPAIVAVSPQAPVTDYHDMDDYYRNGALMLEATYFYEFFRPQKTPVLPAASDRTPLLTVSADAYDEFKQDWEPLPVAKARLNNAYFNEVVDHPDYDPMWSARDISKHLHNIHAAVLVVGGWFDAEDVSGPYKTFNAIAAQSPATQESLVIGPWVHGGWGYHGAGIGDVKFGSDTGTYFREKIEFPFFEHYLKGGPDPALAKATVFETGTNVWKTYAAWPPPGSKKKMLYLRAGGKLSFDPPAAGEAAFDHYVSDPAHPVPEVEYAHRVGPPQAYMDADQRFAATRNDVLVYETEPLTEDVTFAGPLKAKLQVATSGTDSDFDVKVIDVYPQTFAYADSGAMTTMGRPADVTAPPTLLGGYEQLVRGEPGRGKYRRSLAKPEPFTPNKPEAMEVSLVEVNHTFLKGHRIMVQIQSSWFPLVDLNPQVFEDISKAKPGDFKAATERVYHSVQLPSGIEFQALP